MGREDGRDAKTGLGAGGGGGGGAPALSIYSPTCGGRGGFPGGGNGGDGGGATMEAYQKTLPKRHPPVFCGGKGGRSSPQSGGGGGGGGALGGAIFCYQSRVTIHNCTFLSNQAEFEFNIFYLQKVKEIHLAPFLL